MPHVDQSAIETSNVDIVLTDHRLLTWTSPAHHEPRPLETVTRRCWRMLAVNRLREKLPSTSLCSPGRWPTDFDDLAALFDGVFNIPLDRLVPLRQSARRPRPSDLWFDHDAAALNFSHVV